MSDDDIESDTMKSMLWRVDGVFGGSPGHYHRFHRDFWLQLQAMLCAKLLTAQGGANVGTGYITVLSQWPHECDASFVVQLALRLRRP